jgi:hypothetical protein
MGYARVAICLDHRDTAAAAEELLAALAERSPTEAAATDRWRLGPRWHTTTPVALCAHADGVLEVLAGPGVNSSPALHDDALGWQPKVPARELAELARTTRRDPRVAQRVAAAGVEAVVGRRAPDPSQASVWLVRLDGADLLAAHGAALPGRIDAVLRDRWEETAGPPGFPQALEHLGSFTHPDGEVRLMWSGNRVCVPSELTERERVHLARHWD